MKELVIDVSWWDGDIDFKAWKKEQNLWGVIIKAGGFERELGRYEDSYLKKHYIAAKDAGLHIGFYYYTISTTIEDARKDANHFADIIDGSFYDLPCYMDVEDPGQFKNGFARGLTDVIKTFCDTLISRGYYAGIYTGENAWLNNMYRDELMQYANWIASWKSTWPEKAGDIGMWQQGCMRLSDGDIVFDDKNGYCDVDWCCIDYPSRINSGSIKQETEVVLESTNQNGSNNDCFGRASDVIDAAYGELGYYAPNDPDRGSKYGRWMAELLNEDWLAGPSNEIWWCCMFTSWCLDRGGVKMDGFPTYNTDVALNNGAKKYAVDKYDVRYGDIVIFNWDWNNTTDHIGFATGEFDGYGFTTIEGNIGNAVQEKYRQMGNVAYVLRPPYLANGVVSNNTPAISTDPKNNRDGGKLDVDGIGGWNTIIDLQNQLGVDETGAIDGQSSSNKSFHKGMSNVTYEDTGSQTVEAIQKLVGSDVDGYWGRNTSTKFQEWLINKGYDCGTCGADGYFGHDSVVALQKALNDGALK